MQYLEIAKQAALAAGNVVMAHYGNIASVTLKDRNDYLTNADIEAENKIKEIILAAFPDHGIVAEESERERVKSEYQWFIDPISSTINFVHGLPHFGVAISLMHGQDIIAAAVLDPYYKQLWSAEKGIGAFLDDKQIHVSQVDSVAKSMINAIVFNKGNEIEASLASFDKIARQASGVRSFGSTGLQLCYVASGWIEAYVNPHSDMFAIPAGKLILTEAGGTVTDFQNKPWVQASGSVIASNGHIHQGLVKILGD